MSIVAIIRAYIIQQLAQLIITDIETAGVLTQADKDAIDLILQAELDSDSA